MRLTYCFCLPCKQLATLALPCMVYTTWVFPIDKINCVLDLNLEITDEGHPEGCVNTSAIANCLEQQQIWHGNLLLGASQDTFSSFGFCLWVCQTYLVARGKGSSTPPPQFSLYTFGWRHLCHNCLLLRRCFF